MLSQKLLTINIAHLSKSVVNLNLVIMLKPKYLSFLFSRGGGGGGGGGGGVLAY